MGGRDKHTGKEGIAFPTGMDGCCMKLLKKSQRRTIVRHGAWSRPGPAVCCLLRRPSVLPTFLLLHSRSGRSPERLYPPQVPGVAVTPQSTRRVPTHSTSPSNRTAPAAHHLWHCHTLQAGLQHGHALRAQIGRTGLDRAQRTWPHRRRTGRGQARRTGWRQRRGRHTWKGAEHWAKRRARSTADSPCGFVFDPQSHSSFTTGHGIAPRSRLDPHLSPADPSSAAATIVMLDGSPLRHLAGAAAAAAASSITASSQSLLGSRSRRPNPA